MLRIAVLIIAFIVFGPARADAIDDIVRAEMARQHIPGLAIAVARNGRVVRETGYGLANVEHGVRVTPRTRFQSASVGKTFTAAMVMKLVEDGRLALDEPVATYLPGTPAGWSGMTLRHLLSHTSGLPAIDEAIDLRRDYSEQQLLESIFRLPLLAPPGTRWSYGNLGYEVLGVLISKVGGRFYGDQLRERLFEPAALSARVISESDIVPHRAAGYERVKGELRNQQWVAPSINTTADGSLYLTAGDLARWAIALQAGRVLKPESVMAMWSPARLASGEALDWGLGWKLDNFGGHRVVQHTGRWQGFTSHFAIYPDDRLAVAVLVNRSGSDALAILDRITGHYLPDLRAPMPPPLTAASYTRAPLHVRGSMNGWDTSAPLVPGAAGVYEVELALAAGPQSLKIAAADWNAMDLGARFDEYTLALGSAKPLVSRGGNLELDLPRAGRYVFTLDARRPTAPTLSVRER